MDLGRKGCFNEESIYKRTGFIFGGNFLLVLGGQIFTRVTGVLLLHLGYDDFQL